MRLGFVAEAYSIGVSISCSALSLARPYLFIGRLIMSENSLSSFNSTRHGDIPMIQICASALLVKVRRQRS